jgi:hypothetical protein
MSRQTIHVDKSKFVMNALSSSHKCRVILRPRGFGKTMNLSMLDYYCSYSVDNVKAEKIFGNLDVGKNAKLWSEHRGKYAVVRFSLNECDSKEWIVMRRNIDSVLSRMLEPHLDCIRGVRMKTERVSRLLGNLHELCDAYLSHVLGDLTQVLHQETGRKVIVLVDDYDTPWRTRLTSAEDEERRDSFFRPFFSHAFKDNKFLHKAYIMGTFYVDGFDIPAVIHSGDDSRFYDCFGFTEDEVLTQIQKRLNVSVDQARAIWVKPQGIKQFYHGYSFNQSMLTHPATFVSCIANDCETSSHWCRPSEVQTLIDQIKDDPAMVQKMVESIDMLLQYETTTGSFKHIPGSAYMAKVNVENHWNITEILNYLCMWGYLVSSYPTSSIVFTRFPTYPCGELSIPNLVLQHEWRLLRAELKKPMHLTP